MEGKVNYIALSHRKSLILFNNISVCLGLLNPAHSCSHADSWESDVGATQLSSVIGVCRQGWSLSF